MLEKWTKRVPRRVVKCRGCGRPHQGSTAVCSSCRRGLDGLDWYPPTANVRPNTLRMD
mgnify:CR=1 FL=1